MRVAVFETGAFDEQKNCNTRSDRLRRQSGA